MASIEEIEEKLALREEKRRKNLEKLKKLEEISKLPFYLRIQAKGNEEQLKKIEENQLWAMSLAWKKWDIPKDECKSLGGEFMVEFLNGEVPNINTFLEKRNYKRKND